jgi:hypothetical protein
MTPREKFGGLIRNDILRVDLAELDFGINRIRLQQDTAYISKRLNRLKDCR